MLKILRVKYNNVLKQKNIYISIFYNFEIMFQLR